MISNTDLLALQLLEGVGDQSIRKIISKKYNTIELLSLSEKEMKTMFSNEKAIHSFKNNFSNCQEKAEYEIEKLKNIDIDIISYYDNDYPKILGLIDDFPIFLYCIGNKSLLRNNKNIAVIGTRDNSDVGQKIATSTASYFAKEGYTIVSGLAKGIDAIAHTAALDAKGNTIAVLIDVSKIYPKENIQLSKRILNNNGLLISENKPGSYQGKNSFVLRDRIQSGLSIAIFPIETDVVGGTMHTVKYAKKQGRLIFVPDVYNSSLINLYSSTVGSNYSKINGIKELLKLGTAFPYVKDSYPTVANKINALSKEIFEKKSFETFFDVNIGDNPIPNTNLKSVITNTNEVNSVIENTKSELQLDTGIVSNTEEKESEIHLSTDNYFKDKEDVVSKEDRLVIEFIKYFKAEFDKLTMDNSSIINNKDKISESIKNLYQDLKKVVTIKKQKSNKNSGNVKDLF